MMKWNVLVGLLSALAFNAHTAEAGFPIPTFSQMEKASKTDRDNYLRQLKRTLGEMSVNGPDRYFAVDDSHIVEKMLVSLLMTSGDAGADTASLRRRLEGVVRRLDGGNRQINRTRRHSNNKAIRRYVRMIKQRSRRAGFSERLEGLPPGDLELVGRLNKYFKSGQPKADVLKAFISRESTGDTGVDGAVVLEPIIVESGKDGPGKEKPLFKGDEQCADNEKNRKLMKSQTRCMIAGYVIRGAKCEIPKDKNKETKIGELTIKGCSGKSLLCNPRVFGYVKTGEKKADGICVPRYPTGTITKRCSGKESETRTKSKSDLFDMAESGVTDAKFKDKEAEGADVAPSERAKRAAEWNSFRADVTTMCNPENIKSNFWLNCEAGNKKGKKRSQEGHNGGPINDTINTCLSAAKRLKSAYDKVAKAQPEQLKKIDSLIESLEKAKGGAK